MSKMYEADLVESRIEAIAGVGEDDGEDEEDEEEGNYVEEVSRQLQPNTSQRTKAQGGRLATTTVADNHQLNDPKRPNEQVYDSWMTGDVTLEEVDEQYGYNILLQCYKCSNRVPGIMGQIDVVCPCGARLNKDTRGAFQNEAERTVYIKQSRQPRPSTPLSSINGPDEEQ